MMGLNPTFSCSYTCGIPAIDISVSGPSSICGGQALYVLNNVPSGTIANWIYSSNLSYVSGQGTNALTVAAGTSGPGFVRATINAACGGSLDRSAYNFTGTFSSSDYSITALKKAAHFNK
jgi:PKD-like domain